jgi:hypothetical protein
MESAVVTDSSGKGSVSKSGPQAGLLLPHAVKSALGSYDLFLNIRT